MRRCHSAQHVARLFAVEKDPLPDFEIDEKPQPIAMLTQAVAMLVHQLRQGAPLEETARAGASAEHELVDDRSEGSAQPATERHREPHLRPRENGRRDEIGHRRA
jgi:hypothetical protein